MPLNWEDKCLRKVGTSLFLSYHGVVVQDADTVFIHSNPHQSVLLRRQLGRLQKQKAVRPTVRDSEPSEKKVHPESDGQPHHCGIQKVAFIQHRECCGRRHLALGLCHPTSERWRESHLPEHWVESSEQWNTGQPRGWVCSSVGRYFVLYPSLSQANYILLWPISLGL